MAATAARCSFMNHKQFEDRIPYQTPIIAVNLPKRRRSHPFTSNDKRPLQLNCGAIEGPRRLRVGYKRSLPDYDSFHMEVDFLNARLDDPLLADVFIKRHKYFSSRLADEQEFGANAADEERVWAVLFSGSKLINKLKQEESGANATDEERVWPVLFAESKLINKPKQEFSDSVMRYIQHRIHKETSNEDFEMGSIRADSYIYDQLHGPKVAKWLTKYGYAFLDKLQVKQVDFLMDDPLLAADVVTKERKYFSSLIAELIVNANKRKLGVDEEPLWANLVAESKICKKLQQEYKDSKLRLMRRRLPIETSEEDFEKMLHSITIELNTKGHQYSAVVTNWLKKYGLLVKAMLHTICLKSWKST